MCLNNLSGAHVKHLTKKTDVLIGQNIITYVALETVDSLKDVEMTKGVTKLKKF